MASSVSQDRGQPPVTISWRLEWLRRDVDWFIPLDHTAWWSSFYTIAGWALAAMLVAGLTGLFKRQ